VSKLAIEIISALSYSQDSQGINHGNLKPENVLLSEDD